MTIAEITRRITEHVEWCNTCEAHADCPERQQLEAEAERIEAVTEAEDIVNGRGQWKPVRYRIEWHDRTTGERGATDYYEASEAAAKLCCSVASKVFPAMEYTYRREE